MKLIILKWIKGWAMLVNGIVIILSLGYFNPEYTDNANVAILKEMFAIHKRKGQ